LVASVNGNLGTLALSAGDFADAALRYGEAAAFFCESGHDLDAAISLDHLAILELLQDRPRSAADPLRRALALSRKVANADQLATTLHTVAMVALAEGDLGAATDALEEALDLSNSAGDPAKIAAVVEGFAAASAAASAMERAARLFGFAEAYRSAGGISDPVTRALAAPHIARVRRDLPAESLEQAWSAGRTMTLDEAMTHMRLSVARQPVESASARRGR
jgi:tetratricopeptide (TPR) repeat protein